MNRSVAVMSYGEISRVIDLVSGVPQGSNVGPLFAVLFVDDTF